MWWRQCNTLLSAGCTQCMQWMRLDRAPAVSAWRALDVHSPQTSRFVFATAAAAASIVVRRQGNCLCLTKPASVHDAGQRYRCRFWSCNVSNPVGLPPDPLEQASTVVVVVVVADSRRHRKTCGSTWLSDAIFHSSPRRRRRRRRRCCCCNWWCWKHSSTAAINSPTPRNSASARFSV